jgi:hypothetical protein
MTFDDLPQDVLVALLTDIIARRCKAGEAPAPRLAVTHLLPIHRLCAVSSTG